MPVSCSLFSSVFRTSFARSTTAAGRPIGELDIRKRTESSIVALVRDDGTSLPNPDPSTTIEKDDVLVVIGTVEAVERLKALLVE